jgi:hypothetical protein
LNFGSCHGVFKQTNKINLVKRASIPFHLQKLVSNLSAPYQPQISLSDCRQEFGVTGRRGSAYVMVSFDDSPSDTEEYL